MKMYQLFKKPNSWTRGDFAKTSLRGESVEPNDKDAKCFCLQGAIEHCYPGKQRATIRSKLTRYILDNFPNFMYIEHFNDDYRKLTREKVQGICRTLNI